MKYANSKYGPAARGGNCAPRQAECPYCRGSFVHGYGPSRGGDSGKLLFCSADCSRKFHRFPDQEAHCAQCGIGYSHRTQASRRHLRRYCSLQCAGMAKSRPGIANGYVYNRRDGRRIADHVHAAEKVLGRRLKRGEVVHHINGNKLDNRNQNLLICTRGYHVALHFRMSDLWQREKFGQEVQR